MLRARQRPPVRTPPPGPARSPCPSRDTSWRRWSGALAPLFGRQSGGRACRDRGGSGRRAGACRARSPASTTPGRRLRLPACRLGLTPAPPAASTRPWPWGAAARRRASDPRWARSGTPTTTPSARASSPPSNASSSTAGVSRPRLRRGSRSSTSSRAGTTRTVGTPRSTTSRRCAMNSSTAGRRHDPRKSEPVHETGATPPLPPQHGVWRHDHEGRSPSGPAPGQPDPQEPIRPAQPGPRERSLVHGELVAQGEVLQSELAVAAAEEREESEQVEQRGDHGARFSPDQRRRSIAWPPEGGLARDRFLTSTGVKAPPLDRIQIDAYTSLSCRADLVSTL